MMIRRFCCAVVLSIFTVIAVAEEQPWPQANGPRGNFTAIEYGHELVGDLNAARLKWKSETTDLGYGKGTASGYVQNLAKWPGHPGSCSAPIVAGGKVFVTSFRPTGDVWADGLPHLRDKERFKPLFDEYGDKLRDNLRIVADDLLVAIDQETGKTVWTAAEEKKGVNLYMGKREGFCVSPACHDGMVFSMGTTGRLYAYDAASGRKLWETHIGPAHEQMEANKAEALEKRTLPKKIGWDASLTVADGVLIVPLYDHSVDMSLRGVNVKSGETIWELAEATSRYAVPAQVPHEGKTYLLTATRSGTLQMISPKDGKRLWQVDGLGANWCALSPSDTHVLVNVGSKKAFHKEDQPKGLMACYRISPAGAELAWTMPDEPAYQFTNKMDSSARRRTVIDQGRVYFYSQHKNEKNERLRNLSIWDAAMGKLLHTGGDLEGGPFMYRIEDRLLYIVDGSHSDSLTMKLFTADPKDFRELGERWKPPHTSTTGYEVYQEIPYVDGCIYMRTREGDVRCYDLRKS